MKKANDNPFVGGNSTGNLKQLIDQFRYIKIIPQKEALGNRPRAEVYCFRLNFNISKLVYCQTVNFERGSKFSK